MFESSTDTVNVYNATLTADGDYANGQGQRLDAYGSARRSIGWEKCSRTMRASFALQGLPYGQYLVVETTIPKDVFQCDPFIVTVDANSPQSRFTVPSGGLCHYSYQ